MRKMETKSLSFDNDNDLHLLFQVINLRWSADNRDEQYQVGKTWPNSTPEISGFFLPELALLKGKRRARA